MFNIIVCMKIIIDPEMPFSMFKVDKETLAPCPASGMPPVFSPFDENALEAALKIKDRQECQVTILSMGKNIPKALMQKGLALGADEVIGVEGPEFDHLDPYSTVHAMAHAIKKIGKYDLVFTGRQGADWDSGLVWAGIAEILDMPSVTIARHAEIQDGKVIVERCVSDGIETLECDLPALVSFSSEAGELRNMSLPALVKIKKREIPKWSASDVGFEKIEHPDIKALYEPDIQEVVCFFMPEESHEDKGRHLARKLMEEISLPGNTR